MQKIRLADGGCVLPEVMEQNEYLLGVLYGDEDHRLDCDPTRDVSNEIDAYGPGSTAFWRGVIETAGYVSMPTGREYAYPLFSLKGSFRFLSKFLDFMQDAEPGFDADGKLNFQAGGRHIRITGTRAQLVVRALYMNDGLARESARRIADQVLAWTPKR